MCRRGSACFDGFDNPAMLWDLFCRVIDNHGDIGVCWRAATDLAERGERVRLWVDDASALAWMAPAGHSGVHVMPWTAADEEAVIGEVVIEAFGCELPPAFVEHMAATTPQPVWINLEYLSAESYVDRSHGLRSPQGVGPATGMTKWFFYPGFTPRTGGLLREPGLIERLDSVAADPWLAARGLTRRAGERVVSLFCYENPALPRLLTELAGEPTLLLATAGAATAQVHAVLGSSQSLGQLRAAPLPYMAQPQFDELLAVCDLNIVRGEDSFVRAQWAGRPFVWHIYAQSDGAHAAKLKAFLDLFLVGADPLGAAGIRALWWTWNGLSAQAPQLPDAPWWRAWTEAWRDGLRAVPDLVTQLIGFATERR